MHYETAAQMASRLNVNIRTVQIWASSGKLPGAIKQGRDWLIPIGTNKPNKHANAEKSTPVMPYPMLSYPFEPGKALETAQNKTNEMSRVFALAEYYYFSSQPKLAAEQLKLCLENDDDLFRLAAQALCVFNCLSGANLHELKPQMQTYEALLKKELAAETLPQRKAYCLLISTNMDVLLHRPADVTPLYHHIKYLPLGLQLWGFYLLSYLAYSAGNYRNALGIIHTVLAIPSQHFPIPEMYLHLCGAMCEMSLKNPDKAKIHMEHVLSLCLPDQLFSGISEHYPLLTGLPDVTIKTTYPEIYERILKNAKRFAPVWLYLHNQSAEKPTDHRLSMSEFTMALLASRNWSNMEIANFFNYSVHTVKRYISIIYQKLGITSRNQLREHIQ